MCLVVFLWFLVGFPPLPALLLSPCFCGGVSDDRKAPCILVAEPSGQNSAKFEWALPEAPVMRGLGNETELAMQVYVIVLRGHRPQTRSSQGAGNPPI